MAHEVLDCTCCRDCEARGVTEHAGPEDDDDDTYMDRVGPPVECGRCNGNGYIDHPCPVEDHPSYIEPEEADTRS